MRKIGLIGGMSWESTAVYYRLMNEMVRAKLGGLASAELVLWSFNFEEIVALQKAGEWEEATVKMVEAGNALKAAGVVALVICTNTMHRLAGEIYRQTNLPVIHIVDAVAGPVRQAGFKKVGLLATKFNMEQDFFTGRLKSLHGIEAVIPNEAGRDALHDIIFGELCVGAVREESKKRVLGIISEMVGQGAQGVILGCTEICMLIGQGDVDVPVFDSTYLHAKAAVEFSTGG